MPNPPFFSVVIPTRERADTLHFCLQSCITQNFDDVEFLVSDNFSADNTLEVVASFTDSRIRRVNPGRRLSMQENYEFALSQAAGRYMIFIGDDDALMPAGLRTLKAALDLHPVEAVKWATPTFYWPNYKSAALASKIALSLNTDAALVSARGALNAARWGYLPFAFTPMIYHGAVSSDLVRTICAKDGRFFHSEIPDVYSGLAIAASTKEYLFLSKPVSMHGASSHSTGIAIFDRARNLDSQESEATSAAGKFLAEVNGRGHPDFMPVAEMPAAQAGYITECLYQVRDAVMDGKLYIAAWFRLWLMMREMARTTGDFHTKSTPLMPYAARHRLIWLFRLLRTAYASDRPKLDEQNLPRWTPAQQRLVIEVASLGVTNVFDAAQFAARFFPETPLAENLPRITALKLFFGKVASVLVGAAFRRLYPWGGYMR